MSLFRKEVLSEQSNRLTGTIVLAQPLSIKVTVAILLAIGIVTVAFLFSAEYARKETVRGFLMPNKGFIKSFATQGGTIENVLVKEGDKVEKGQGLVSVVIHQNNAEGASLSSQLQQQLTAQLTLLDEEVQQHRTIQRYQQQNIDDKVLALENERSALHRQLALANEKLDLLLLQQNDIAQLNRQGFISKFEQQNQQQALLEAQQEQQNIARLLLQQNNQISQARFDKANLPQQYRLRINALLREKATVANRLAQVESNHSYTVTASHTGTVTGIQVVAGETLSPTKAQAKPLLHILPEGAELVAELLLPTRSAGFIAKGQISRLRFDAFPYQRFGFIESTVTRIDRALVSPAEVQLPITLQEPVYRLRAHLSTQQMHAYGQAFELKSGMLLEADIMLQRRTLIDWLLEPIYSLKGRVS